MGDIGGFEAAHHMDDGVDLADVGEELVAEALALGRAAHQAGDVDEFQCRRHHLLRLRDPRHHVEARIGHRYAADVGLDRAERIVGRGGGGRLGQRIEEGRLADVRQADDAAVEAHVTSLILSRGEGEAAFSAASGAAGRGRARSGS